MKSKNSNFVKKIINYLLNVLIFLFAIILLISIYTGVQTKILGNDYPDFFGYSMFEVQTGSMEDAINAGDWIIVRLTKKVELDDIVTYELDGEYITHRIVDIYGGTYITKGDANSGKDEPIDQNQIVGKVVSVLANLGIFKKTLFNPSVLIAIIITVFLFDLAFKKNKVEYANKMSKTKREENKYLFFEVIVKKIHLWFNAIIKKIGSLFDNIKENNISKTESKNLESYKPSFNFDKLKAPLKGKAEEQSKAEDELDKTSFFRIIPVDSTEVDDKFKNIPIKTKADEHYKDEDELDKTLFHRVVTADVSEVGNNFKNIPTKAEVEEHYKDEDELDKTSMYRIIPVDASEVDDTFLEIAENEMKEAEQNKKSKEKLINLESMKDDKTEVEEDTSLTNIDLNLLKNRKTNKKGKTIIDSAMLIKKEELSELINVLVEDDNPRANEATIKNTFINTYIDIKYYNYYGDNDNEYCGKKLLLKVQYAYSDVASALIKGYKGNYKKYNNMVDEYASAFILIASLDQARDSITDSKAKTEFFRKEITKYSKDWDSIKIEYIIGEITKIQKTYIGMLEEFIKKSETNMFDLKFNKLFTKKDMYGLELNHNITFSKVYSDYIIDKTYTEGIVAEDKLSVLLTLLSIQLIKDMVLSDFNKKYILYIPESLYDKDKKFERLLRMMDDKYAKDNVIILIAVEDLVGNKQIIKRARKMGYKFALAFDKETVLTGKNRGDMYIADYIFINKNIANYSEILPFIPEELLDNVIYEDIFDKIGDFGGE